MSTKIITVAATPPAESSGADYNKGAPLNATEFDQNLINLRAAVDRRALASSSDALTVGALTATSGSFTGEIFHSRAMSSGDAALSAKTISVGADTTYAFRSQTGNGSALTGTPLYITTAAAGSWTSTGLAVTGSGSFTGKAVLGDGFSLTIGGNSNVVAANTFITQFETANILRSYLCGSDGSNRAKWEVYTALSTGTEVKVLDISSTGLDVTGATSATGNARCNINSGFTLANAYDFYVAAVDDTHIDLRMRGTDGATRSVRLTLT